MQLHTIYLKGDDNMSIIHQIYNEVNSGNLTPAFDYREHLNYRISRILIKMK